VLRLVIIVPAQPDIIPLGHAPVLALLRIQSTIESHQPVGYVEDELVAIHARQVASIVVGSAHIIIPVVRPLTTSWFIHAVIELHHAEAVAPEALVAAQPAQAWLMLAIGTTSTASEAAGLEVSSRDATASPMPMPPNTMARTTAGTSHRRCRRAGDGTTVNVSVMCPSSAVAGTGG